MANKPYPYYDVAEPEDLRELIDFCADEYADKTAFWYKNKSDVIKISFQKLKEDIIALGSFLINKGYHQKHIAILGENSYAWIVAYFAVVNSGNVVVPLDKEAVAETIKEQLGFSDSVLLFHSDTYSDIADFCEINHLNFKSFADYLGYGEALLESGDQCYSQIVIDAEMPCAIVFTSGTTSAAKGVMLSHKNLMTDAIISSKNLLVPEGTVSLLPFYHTFGFMACVICQMLKGYPVYISSSLKRAFDDINFARPKHVAVVPMLLIAIYNKIWNNVKQSKKESLFKFLIKVSNLLLAVGIDIRRKAFKQVFDAFGGELEMLITGGAAIDEKYIKGFRDIGIKVINGYGITECSPIVATMRNDHYAPDSVGSIHPGLEVRVVEDEIQIKGPTVFEGYYKNRELTEEAFDGEWFKTGDLGYTDGSLMYITGRKKNLIILSNGKNVSPEELEELLQNTTPLIKKVVVYGKSDKIVAEIYPDYDVDNVESIINRSVLEVNRKLPTFKQIASIKFRTTEFPKTTTKKIKRNYGG